MPTDPMFLQPTETDISDARLSSVHGFHVVSPEGVQAGCWQACNDCASHDLGPLIAEIANDRKHGQQARVALCCVLEHLHVILQSELQIYSEVQGAESASDEGGCHPGQVCLPTSLCFAHASLPLRPCQPTGPLKHKKLRLASVRRLFKLGSTHCQAKSACWITFPLSHLLHVDPVRSSG